MSNLIQSSLLIEKHAFLDHYKFTEADINFDDDKAVLMTEKDAVKCFDFASEKHWFVPVKAKPQQQFIDKLLTLIKEKIRG